MEKKRNLYFDAVKGAAILLVVFGHCIQMGSGQAYMDEGSFWNNIVYRAIYACHMPLFMLVSGYFFGSSVQRHSLGEVICSRFTKVLLPIFVWTTFVTLLYEVLQFVRTHQLDITVASMIRSYRTEQWFLWAVFWCSMTVLVLHIVCRDHIWAYVAVWVILPFALSGSQAQLYEFMYPYFAVGYLCNIKGKRLQTGDRMLLYFIPLVLLYVGCLYFFDSEDFIYTTGIKVSAENFPRQLGIDYFRWAMGFVGSGVCMTAIKAFADRKPDAGWLKILAAIGKRSLGIYIISGYINEFFLKGMTKGFFPNYLINLAETVLIVAVAYGMTWLLGRNKITSRLLLGGR